ncbi:uncharacterized protein [Eucyclogobius newberryi]|uniref:uncharacterized protein isoform X2 n=1 Tax=Eucyclogobius newberryi TaxID=166745 RepID=UPI003B5BD9C4
MDKNFAELLSDAFSESSIPSFSDDEDFENLDLKVDSIVLSQDDITADQEDFSPLLEIASASIYQSDQEILDAEYNSKEKNSSPEEENKAKINEKLENSIDQTHTSNDNDAFYATGRNQSQNALDIASFVETPSTYPCDDAQGTFSAKNTEEFKVKVRLEDCTSSEDESREDEGDIEEKPGDVLETVGQDSHQEEEEGYFGPLQGHKGKLTTQDESSEEEHETESTKTTFFQVEYTLEYPEISYDGMEEFNEDVELENFSEEEHQEAGESFADYPSDFSSCEYVDGARSARPGSFESALDRTTENAAGHESAATGDTFLNNDDCFDRSSELRGEEELDRLEMTNKYINLSENRDNIALESWSNAEEGARGLTDLNVTWENQSETTERDLPTVSRDEACLATVSSSSGSVDDSFFFDDEAEVYDVTEEEEMEEDEEEERRKEQARIQAFYRFYDEQDGDSKEERQTKVQFCVETLSQVIHYDTDSGEFCNSSDEEKEEEEEEEEEPEEEEEEEEQEEETEEVEEEEEQEKEKKEEEQEKEKEKEEEEGQKEEKEREEEEEEKEREEEEEEKEREKEEEEKEREEEEEEEDKDQTDNVETCPSAGSDEAVLLSSQELLEVEDLTLTDSPPEIPGKMTASTNKPTCNRNHRCVSVLKLILSLFLVVAMGLIMFWWVSEAEEWPHFGL